MAKPDGTVTLVVMPSEHSSTSAVKTPLHDAQNTRDTRELPIDKVGVRRLRFPIQVQRWYLITRIGSVRKRPLKIRHKAKRKAKRKEKKFSESVVNT